MQSEHKDKNTDERRLEKSGSIVTAESELLPTGKANISFSEFKMWKDCSYRHNLCKVKKLESFQHSPILDFGTAVHAAHENFINTRQMNVKIATDKLVSAWKMNSYKESLDKACGEAEAILSEVPQFYDLQFPNWESVGAELYLYERIGDTKHFFKGYIDAIIKAPGKRGEELQWIIDVKTSQNGWRKDKRSDETLKYQLALYKNFWLKKNPTLSIKNVRCAFVILNKSAKPGKHCELFTVSLGEVPIKRSLKVVSNMLASVKKGICLKNRDSCKYCEFKDTEHCT